MGLKENETFVRIQYLPKHKIIEITECKKNYEKSKRIDEYENGNSTKSTILKTADGIKCLGPVPLYDNTHHHI